jgi:hypothetical protein
MSTDSAHDERRYIAQALAADRRNKVVTIESDHADGINDELTDLCDEHGRHGAINLTIRCISPTHATMLDFEADGDLTDIRTEYEILDDDDRYYIADISWSIPTAAQRLTAELAGESRPWIWITIQGGDL